MFSPLGASPRRTRAYLLALIGRRHRCLLVYRTPGTSAQFSVSGVVVNLRRREQVEYLCLSDGCELRLDWLVAVHEPAEAA
ncbi:hypothetical protein [Hymenobacter weizhouensis]|uniref:hypothetical protein n=1 Tax=Hymenobacter sp. YIM 151500-1 TaxID=2987689 RepID=UPI002227A7C1|nr:hypothetical protein [Hymenobacter sp. YIM 151500-1]UYZ62065.1 hypothetical protein OIS53_13750 [Hymenobacter sp. YIM 151500-1]